MELMIDLETLGKKPGSVILSIGAVMFDNNGMYSEFYQGIDPVSCVQAGLTIDPDTVMWWLKQSDNARHTLTLDYEQGKTLPLANVLGNFRLWALQHDVQGAWGHGSVFDISLLDAAFRATGIDAPWPFFMVRDTRTLYELAAVTPERDEGHHNALTDAKAQALAAIKALRKLGVDLETVRFSI